MQSEEKQLIENLFGRLKQAEIQSGPRDSEAEKLIQQQIQRQPGAPYYMAQSILIQEAAMKQLNNRVSELEAKLAQTRAPQQSSGGFLSGLFGGGQQRPQTTAQPQQSAWNSAPPQPSGYAPAQPAPSATRGFLGGALQTAVGVAGGVVMADMLTSMFNHSQPEEIVNIINEPAMPQADFANDLDTFNGNDEQFANQDVGFQQDDSSDFGSDDFGNDNFGDDDNFI